MKKILLATTLLAGFAGAAYAEVTLSGDARMGVISDEGADMTLTSRARVTFNMSAESDSGLSFGASFRADNAVDAAEGFAGSVYISGAFGKLSIGDVDPADKAAVGNVSGVGLTGIGDLNEIYYYSSYYASAGYDDLGSMLYSYSAGDLTVMLGANNPDASYSMLSAGVNYTVGGVKLAAGYSSSDEDGSQMTFGATYTTGPVTLKAVGYTSNDYLDDTGYALSADYVTGAMTVTGFYSDDTDRGTSAMGVGATYDLGGGASVVGGISKEEGDDASYDLGVSMTF